MTAREKQLRRWTNRMYRYMDALHLAATQQASALAFRDEEKFSRAVTRAAVAKARAVELLTEVARANGGLS